MEETRAVFHAQGVSCPGFQSQEFHAQDGRKTAMHCFKFRNSIIFLPQFVAKTAANQVGNDVGNDHGNRAGRRARRRSTSKEPRALARGGADAWAIGLGDCRPDWCGGGHWLGRDPRANLKAFSFSNRALIGALDGQLRAARPAVAYLFAPFGPAPRPFGEYAALPRRVRHDGDAGPRGRAGADALDSPRNRLGL